MTRRCSISIGRSNSTPTSLPAYGMAARCYSQRKTAGWMTDRAQEIAETDAAGPAGRRVGQG